MKATWRSAQVSLVFLLAAGGSAACGATAGRAPLAPPKAYAAVLQEASAQPAEPAPPGEKPRGNTEASDRIVDNPFLAARTNPLSTFGVDVDTASYSNTRRFLLGENRLPPKDAVRIEELVNYFPYDYPQPSGDAPVSVMTDVAACPWKADHRLVRIGVQARRVDPAAVPAKNLVFLVDVSGSMNEPDKLPLVVRSLHMLAEQLTAKDRIAIVVYAGTEGLALPSTPGDKKDAIFAALDRLSAGGSTNGGAGIQLAYKIAREGYIPGGINRVLIATDGDFNVGVTSRGDLVRLLESERKSGVFLTVLGVGTGNIKDSAMEQLADVGNGNYAYLDSDEEAKKVLVTQAASTLVTVAKDVKVQVEFNPERVKAYRLIGYEDRVMRSEDFKDDARDSGDMGAGHSVTALYEVAPPGTEAPAGSVDALKYQTAGKPTGSRELLTVKLRYKQPDADVSQQVDRAVADARNADAPDAEGSEDLRFASAVAAFGMLLRDSPYKGAATWTMVRGAAERGKGSDPHGYRAEFLRMVAAAERLSSGQKPVAQ
jgi:Ca-activated chloride channel family protein